MSHAACGLRPLSATYSGSLEVSVSETTMIVVSVLETTMIVVNVPSGLGWIGLNVQQCAVLVWSYVFQVC